MASNVVDLPNPRSLALADLKRSGLTEKDFKLMRCRALTSDETEAATAKHKARSLLIPYFDVDGHEANFFRLRFLEPTRAFGRQKPQRYYQPPDTPPRAYLPPHIEWKKVFTDPSVPIWITEGEKKAAAAAKQGIACIGLGGVWSWKSTKNRQPILPEFVTIDWQKRQVVLCFDSDAEEKPDVEGALAVLGATLETRGATVFRVQLPLLPGHDKTGLDDFLVERGGAELKKLPQERLATSAELFKLNDELAVIDELGAVLRLRTGDLVTKVAVLKDILYASRRVTVVGSDGRLQETSAVTQWLKWPSRRVHRGVAYEPGQPTVLEDGRYNVWRGWGVSPRAGDCGPFEEYLTHLFGDKVAERKWFEQWLAYPLKHPGVKLYSAVVLWSHDTGTGKSLMGETMRPIYGENYGVVTEARLHDRFNEWMHGKQFVLGEEVTGSDKRSEADKLKHMITGETVSVRKMYQPPFDVRNTVNFYFTSNHPDAFLMDAKDRRYFVWEVTSSRPQRHWDAYVRWLEKPQSAPAVFARLLAVDLDGFNPHAPAPFTDAKRDMVNVSGSEVDFLVRQLYESPERFMKVGDSVVPRDLYTLEEVLAAIDPDGRSRVSRIALAKAMRRQGHRELPVTRTSRGTVRLWALRSEAAWLVADHGTRVVGYDGPEAMPKLRKKPGF